jgi:SAM-dependent methyltransferase/chromosome segregation ATPase
MPDPTARDVFDRRLPLYVYIEPLIGGRRVLEIGSAGGAGADYLAGHGAARVLSLDVDPSSVERARARHRRANLEFRAVQSLADPGALGESFDLVIVPDGESLVRRGDAVAAWKQLLADGGRLVLTAGSADRRAGAAGSAPAAGGVGYYEISDALLRHFPRLQMFGVTPFAGFGVVEFDGSGGDGLRVDSRLVEGGAEPPAAYLAVAGREAAQGLGYALVQIPFAPVEARLTAAAEVQDRGAEGRLAAAERRLDDTERRGRARVEEAEARVAELRRKLDDAALQSESAVRIARAQSEEMEELRGRLRRAADDRAAVDGEMAKLRRALGEAHESVMSLTRRTAEEMSAMAGRLFTAPPEAPLRARDLAAASALQDEVDRLRADLAETEARASVAEQRLEEIGTAGRERQSMLDDTLERLRLAEDATARERREVQRLAAEVRAAAATARALEDGQRALAARDDRIAALEGEKQDLTWRLAELEDSLRQAIARGVVAEGASRGAHSEELAAARAARERALEEFHRAAGAHVAEITDLKAQVAEQSAQVAELEDALREAESRATSATSDAAALRKGAKDLEEADRTRRSRLAELEGKLLRLEHERKQAAARAADTAPDPERERRLAEATRERDELRAELERLGRSAADTEEALWRSKDQLVADREQIGALESELGRLRDAAAAAAAAGRNGHEPSASIPSAVARELEVIEQGVGQEIEALGEIERALGAEAEAGRSNGDGNGLLHTTLGNYRRHAARLRDEVEGLRRRIDSLSPSEISGHLEELEEDLAELEK